MQARFNRLPFSSAYRYKAVKPFVMKGISFKLGDEVDTSDIEVRRLRQMYEARMIDPIMDETGMAGQVVNAPAQPESKAVKATPKVEKPSKVEKEAPATGGNRLEHRGFGRYFLVDANDEVVAGPMTKDEAQKLAA